MPHFRISFYDVFHEDYGYDHDIVLESGYLFLSAPNPEVALALARKAIGFDAGPTHYRQGWAIAREAEEIKEAPPHQRDDVAVIVWLDEQGHIAAAHKYFDNNPSYDKERWKGFGIGVSLSEMDGTTVVTMRTFPHKK